MPSKKQIEEQNEVVEEQRSLFAEIKDLISEAKDELKNMENPLKGATDYFKQINESADLSGDAQKKFNQDLTRTQQGLAAATKGAKKLAQGMKSVADAAADALGEIGLIAIQLLTLSLAGAFASVFAAIVSKFQYDMKQVVNEIGTAFNVVGSDVNKQFEQLVDKAERVGIATKELTDSSRELADNFGMAVSETTQLSFDIADGAKALGVQSKTMATLVGQFQLIGDLTAQQSHELSEQIGLLAAQNDVAPAAVLEDMAASTEDMAIFSKGGIKNFAKTAIEAKKLGMSVKDVANSLKGMLNFEDSLNKELQASVMLGKNINLNEARRLAFAGDTAGAFQAIASELGDVDLGSLDPLTLQSVADAAGMSTEQLLKMSKGADEMGGVDMGEEALSAQERAALRAADSLTEMETLLANLNRDLVNFVAEFGGPLIKALQKVADFISELLQPGGFKKKMQELYDSLLAFDWKGLGTKIGDFLVQGIIDASKVIGSLLVGLFESAFGDMLKAAAVFRIAFRKQMDKMFKAVTKMMRNFKASWLRNVVRPIKNAFRPVSQFIKNVKGSKGFGALSKTFKTISNMAGKLFSPLKVALKPITAVFKSVSGIVKILGVAGKVLGKLFVPLGVILSFFDGLFGGISNIKEGAEGVSGVFQNIFRFLSGFAIGVIEGIFSAFTGLFDMIFGTNITEWFSGVFDTILDGFNFVTDGIVAFFSDIPGSISAALSGLGQIILDGISGIGDLGKTILDLIISGLSNIDEAIKNAINIGAEFFVDLFSGAIEGVKQVPGMIADAFMGIGSLIAEKVSGAFDSIGAMFSSIGESLMNLLPDIDFGEFAGQFADSIKNALSTVTNFIKKPFNFIIRTFNKIKNAISDRVLFKGYTLMTKGYIADNSVFGTIPPFDIGIPKIKTPKLFNDVPELETGGTVTKDGLAKLDAGEVVSGVKGEALKPVADEIGKLKSDMAETNRLLARILSEGIPVMKA